jgi:hypothetical protein
MPGGAECNKGGERREERKRGMGGRDRIDRCMEFDREKKSEF